MLARDVYPECDPAALVEELRGLARPLLPDRLGVRSPRDQALALSAFFRHTLGFRGNADDYGDPRNSLLPDVLARRTGLPIALSLVYVELARSIGLNARGVGFPGHFIVRIDAADRRNEGVFVDPFASGEVLPIEELARRFQRATGVSSQAALGAHLAPIEPGAFLSRWLGNLRGAYLKRGELSRALVVLDRLLELRPDDVGTLRERGLLSYKLGASEAARADLGRVARLDHGGPLGAEAVAVLARLPSTPRSLN